MSRTLCCLLMLLAACAPDEIVKRAELRLATLSGGVDGQASLAGFACTTGPQLRPMLERAVQLEAGQATLRASIVVDLVAVHGYPRCRVSALTNYCSAREGACEAQADERRCFDLSQLPIDFNFAAPAADRLAALSVVFSEYVQQGLSGKVLTDQAGDDAVIVRAVGTAQTCAELSESGSLAFADAQLLGCTYSCPLVLSAARGEVVLDSEAVGKCEGQIRKCAAPEFLPLSLDRSEP